MCSQPSGATWESSSPKITTPNLLHHGMRPSVASNARCGRMAGSTCPHPEAHTDDPQGDPLTLTLDRVDLAAVDRRRGGHNQLGFALQLCAGALWLMLSQLDSPRPAVRKNEIWSPSPGAPATRWSAPTRRPPQV